jgi:6-phosphofructokinase 1
MVGITPSSALGSTRDKPDEAYCERMVEVFQRHDVRYFFYIGGNDSAETCRIVANFAEQKGYDLRVIHIPKTIDNDIRVTDHTPGFGSAAKFVVSAFAGLDLDNFAIPGVFVGVVMGRSAGFLTATSLFARRSPGDGPHLIYVPEAPFSIDRFLADVERVYTKYGRCVAAVCEGIVADAGVPMLLKLKNVTERDPFGNLQLSGRSTLGDALSDEVKTNLKIPRVRCDTFGYLQRSYLGVISDVDASEARDVGETAVHFAVHGKKNGSVAIRRTGDYSVDYFLTALETVAAETKPLPHEFLRGLNDINESYKDYVRPLMGPLPQFDRLIAPPVRVVKSTQA